MSPQGFKITSLQQDVTQALVEAEELLLRASRALGREEHYRGLAEAVAGERRKVSELELRMAIVAPMKAGKSTIVNAILGRYTLPTRNSAMTSLPTEIIRNDSGSESILTLPSGLVSRFTETWKELHAVIKRKGLDKALEATSEYPELSQFVRRVGTDPKWDLQPKVRGTKQIQQVLAELNDICRLCPVLEPGLSPLSGMTSFEVPRLQAPFYKTQSLFSDSNSGKLTIVDTPGPNEARQHHVLQKVVADQLASTSLVLLVLDYTQLNTQAAALVSQDVQRVVGIVGEDNLFVLVNRIDDRNDKGMTPEEVRLFVASHLKLKAPADSKRIFEISAKQAFYAANFLRELRSLGDQPTDDVVRALPSARDLAVQVFGAVSWQEELQEASAAKLIRRANMLWDLSGFDSFLSNAIESLTQEVAPRCISVALKVARAHLLTLRNDATLRHKAIEADAATLKAEIAHLNTELKNLDDSRKALEQRLTDSQQELHEHLRKLRRRLQSWSGIDVREVFLANERETRTFWEQIRKSIKERYVAWFRGDPEAPHEASLKAVFNSQQEANEFAHIAVSYAVGRARPYIEDSLAKLHGRVENTRLDLENTIAKETQPTLKRASQRLQKQFDVQLEIPKPHLGNPLEQLAAPETLTRQVSGGYEEKTRYERKWYTLWLWRHEVKYRVKKADKYIVALDDVAQEVNDSLRQNLDELTERFDEFLAKDFKKRIDGYFELLTQYLGFYRESIQRAQTDQQLSLVERQQTRNQLDEYATSGATMLQKMMLFEEHLGTIIGAPMLHSRESQKEEPSAESKLLLQQQATIGIITALEKEFAAVESMLEDAKTVSVEGTGAGRRYIVGKIPKARGGTQTVALAMLTQMGNNNASIRANQLLTHFPKVRHIIMCGIAGGIPNVENPEENVHLGDVVVSNHHGVVQYDFIKQTADSVEFRHPPRPPSPELLEAVKFLNAESLKGKRPWEKFLVRGTELENGSRPSDKMGANGALIEYAYDAKRQPGLPRVFNSPIASANTLLKNAIFRDSLRERFGTKAVEMEGSGIADATWNSEAAGYLVVRGICDYCDQNKGDIWQGYAAVAAAAYVRALLESMP